MVDRSQVTYEVLVPVEAAERWAQVVENVFLNLTLFAFFFSVAFVATRFIDNGRRKKSTTNDDN